MVGEPDYVMSIEEVAWGLGLIALTLVLHGLGTTWAIMVTERAEHPASRLQQVMRDFARVTGLALLLVLLHLGEVFVWAGFFAWQDCFPTLGLAYYVALLDYTTLGANDDLPQRWRLLEGMIAICGLLTFAWTTSVLMSVAGRIQERRVQRHRLLKEQAAGRHPGAQGSGEA